MINGEKILRLRYKDLEDEQYQPTGLDLTLDTISELKHNDGTTYGLLKNAKVLPAHEKIEAKSLMVSGMIVDAYTLEPNTSYIATTKEKIEINKNSAQFYLPRSSLLRAGIDVRTALGDAGYCGTLSFLIINHSSKPFVLEKGVRFAQLVDMEAKGVDGVYDGDYGDKTKWRINVDSTTEFM